MGPNLDDDRTEFRRWCSSAIATGGQGSGTMPKDLVVGKEAQEVADYVAEVAGE